TYQMIQNPDAQSPLQNNWRSVTVTAPDAHTVVFKLPEALAPFPYNLTNGIVPKHLLASVPPSDLRSADFNTLHPVGAGPFAWQAVQVTGNGDPDKTGEQIALTPFAHYQAGAPKLQKFVVQVFATDTELARAFTAGRLTAAEGLSHVPVAAKGNRSVVRHDLPLRAANMVFFKTSSGVLADKQVRQALVRAADVPRAIAGLDYQTRAVREPLLPGQPGYDPALAQPGFDLSAAQGALAADGWQVGKDGIRSKANQRLSFTLSAADTPEYRAVTSELQRDWRAAGVDARVQLQSGGDFQSTLAYHSYDAVLYGISIGPDPDVFVYWDSSQADIRSANRLNLSEWKNSTADAALEAGRTRLDPALRTIKYKPFLQAWQQDAPALGLYEPRLLYLTQGPVAGLGDQGLNTATDRLDNVQNWEIHEAKVTN
ncbi:MAG TPA: ABC transporter substrate-binding protein, partial [Candidatus Dormibacteraeota bacterium]|nr:ABC transporter substrate-binding protein [Candidatus Dormibacteraeota bacterium]